MHNIIQKNALLVALCGTILLSTIIWSTSFIIARKTTKSIDVKGVASKHVVSDSAQLEVTIESKSQDKKTSYEQLTEGEEKILAFFQKNEIPEKEIGRGIRQTHPMTQYNEERHIEEETGFRSTVTYVIETKDVTKLQPLAEKLNTFAINEIISLSQNQVYYYYTQLESVKKELLESAVKNAQDRAKALGTVTHARIGQVTHASQGIFQVNRSGDTSISDYGNFDTSSVDKEVMVTISVSFEVQ